MKYYVEINGESSLNIQGLAIQSLPSISKPLMRSKRTEIDGRDGDIITKLGYSAYDKTLKIGLWGNYDINQVIAFFNQEGTITFSNEPDKYYNFTILNREDYINQLEAFREASITIHCQPYKYELNEQPVELENEYVEQEGTSLTFNNTLVAPMEIDLKGNTLQNGTPTPSSPIPINNVSGDNDIVVCGKNLFDKTAITENIRLSNTGEVINNNGFFISDYIKVSPNTKYTITCLTANPYWLDLYQYTNDKTFISRTYLNVGEIYNITTGTNTYFIRFSSQITSIDTTQVEQGNQATTYEAYNGTTYNIDLPVENLFDKDTLTYKQGYYTNTGAFSSVSTIGTYEFLNVKPNTTYTMSVNTTLSGLVVVEFNGSTFIGRKVEGNTKKNTFTTGSTTNKIAVFFNLDSTTNVSQTDINNWQPMLEQGSKPNTYTPYGTTPIELNKIGTYQDYFYKQDDKWYKHSEILKLVLNGSENWSLFFNTNGVYVFNPSINAVLTTDTLNGLSNYYTNATRNYVRNNLNEADNVFSIYAQELVIANKSISGTTAFKTWLSTHNVIVYYKLYTPTDTEITYTPLIEQLESIKNAMSKEGTTNVNQVNNDLPFIITASVLSGDNSVVVNNKGNIYSKPIMTIYGSGNIGVYLSDSQIFSINLGDEEYITLDTANMEAYKVGVLKNRLVSGDYNSFKLETGNNTISFTGNVKKVEIQNYSRWI